MINTGDTAFMMICAALVFIMTPGLAFFYGGLVSRKNVLTIMMQSFISMGVVTILWFIIGFSLTFGPDVHGLIGGLKYMFLHGVGMEANPDYGSTIPFMSFFSYQQMFAILTPALITGAFADRVNFKSYLVFLVLWSLLIYIPLAHWVWGGGFLQQMGVVDFAGGIVVHASAGLAALASVFFVGKRTVVSKVEMEPHNVTHVALGTALLWFGWFGFNAGSALGANALAASAFIASQAAAAAATVTWVAVEWIVQGKPTILGAASGCIAGLVAITPAAGFVAPLPALIIGAVGGVICYFAVAVVKAKLGYDDSLDAFGIHGIGGTWGSIATGLWATTEVNPAGADGLFYGSSDLLVAQIISTVVAYALAIVGTFIIFKIISLFMTVRTDKNEEITGLDIGEHGERGYNYAIMSGSPFGETPATPLGNASLDNAAVNNAGINGRNL